MLSLFAERDELLDTVLLMRTVALRLGLVGFLLAVRPECSGEGEEDGDG